MREATRSSLRVAQHLRELRRVEVPLVEQALGRLDDRGDDPRPRHDAADRADGTAPDALGDLTDLELEPRRSGQGVAPLIHRRGAGMCSLSTERHLMALDAERPEDDAER